MILPALVLLLARCTCVRASPAVGSCLDDTNDEFSRAKVGLIISPLVTPSGSREIEVYWYHANHSVGDVIALYEEAPSDASRPIYAFYPNATNGIRKTGIQAEFVPTSQLKFARQCLKYHVAWLRNGRIGSTNCLETRPNWMFERKHYLGFLRMKDIFLPGTHDSASYMKEEHVNSNFVDKYVITQDEDVLSQLIYGVRYLDIRVGYYSMDETKWWANHDFIRIVPLQTVINDVKTFLNNTNEIVIFDVQEFPVGFDKKMPTHRKLVAYLKEQFADYLLPKSYGWSSTLNDIWSSGKRLIIGYDEPNVVALYDSIWPCVTHQWGNVRTVGHLYDYLNKIETDSLRSAKMNPRSAMAELTPSTWDVLFDRLDGLRNMAENVDMNVTSWYSTKWQYSANVVAVDFVKASGIVEVAIEWNDRRHSGC